MDDMWRGDAKEDAERRDDPDQNDPSGRVTPFDGRFAERVVPADGDPSEIDFQARLRGEGYLPPQYRLFWTTAPVARHRGGARWLLVAALILVLGLLFVKPVAVLAALLFAVLLGMLLFGLLAAGTLLLAARVISGGRAPWHVLRR